MYRPTCFQWGFYDPQMSGSIDGTDLEPHDRAINRAYQSKYKCSHNSSSLFIGNIPPLCNENDLAQIFPNAIRINLIRDIVTCESKGYAFLDGHIDRNKIYKFNQHILFIEDVASNKLFGWKPRRCEGGLGGKKQSGQLRFEGSHGQTKIHIDQVKGLESSIFIELEVILQDNQTAEQGQLIAKDLCQQIGIQENNLIKSAYIDLLLEKNSTMN
ncbi:unnamed protein product [Rotaria sp. Silwood1]|nr:unnamed protein product [Rotaria sp. Silwood1]